MKVERIEALHGACDGCGSWTDLMNSQGGYMVEDLSVRIPTSHGTPATVSPLYFCRKCAVRLSIAILELEVG